MTLDLSDWLLIGTLAAGILSYLGTAIATYLRENKRDRAAGFFDAAVRQAAIVGEVLQRAPPGSDLKALKKEWLGKAVDNLKSEALRGDTIKALGFQDAGIRATVEGELAKTLVEAPTTAVATVAPSIPPEAAAVVTPVVAQAAANAALAEQMAALAKAVAALSRPAEAARPPQSGALAMFDKALPTAEEIAAAVVRLSAPKAAPSKLKAPLVAALTKRKAAAPPAPASMDTLDVLARTIWAEARSEGVAGMEAVASVILTRAAHPRWWGSDVRSVCLAPRQFSCWNEDDSQYERIRSVTDAEPLFRQATEIAKRALAGEIEDHTGGADHYFNPKFANPSWARGVTPAAEIGAHRFLRLEVPEPSVSA